MLNVTADGILLALGNMGVLAFFGTRYINKVDAQTEITNKTVATLEQIQQNLKQDGERAERMFDEVFNRLKNLEEVKVVHDLLIDKSECPVLVRVKERS